MQGLLSIVLVVAVGYVAMSAMVYFRQPRYVYVPDRRVEMTPADIGIAFEAVTLTAPDGNAVSGWFVEAPQPSPETRTVLFCHGNGGDIGDRLGYVNALHRNGFNLLIFDYRGYGESGGKASEEHTYEDAMAAWTWLTNTRGIDPGRIIVLGRSLGGAVATHLAVNAAVAGLVVESSFTSARDMAAKMFPFLPVKYCCAFDYDSLSRMPSISCPVLVSHGRADEMIPFSHGQALYQAAREPKTFVEIAGSHNSGGLDVDEEYLRAFVAFAEEI